MSIIDHGHYRQQTETVRAVSTDAYPEVTGHARCSMTSNSDTKDDKSTYTATIPINLGQSKWDITVRVF